MFFVLEEKISDVHTQGRRIRKEVSSNTKASPAKSLLSEKLWHRKTTPTRYFICLSHKYNPTQKNDSIPIYIYIYIYIYIVYVIASSLSFNKYLFIVNGEFFFSLSCQHPGNLFQQITPTVKIDCVIPLLWIFQTTWTQRELIKLLTGKAYRSYEIKAAIKYCDLHVTSRCEYVYMSIHA